MKRQRPEDDSTQKKKAKNDKKKIPGTILQLVMHTAGLKAVFEKFVAKHNVLPNVILKCTSENFNLEVGNLFYGLQLRNIEIKVHVVNTSYLGFDIQITFDHPITVGMNTIAMGPLYQKKDQILEQLYKGKNLWECLGVKPIFTTKAIKTGFCDTQGQIHALRFQIDLEKGTVKNKLIFTSSSLVATFLRQFTNVNNQGSHMSVSFESSIDKTYLDNGIQKKKENQQILAPYAYLFRNNFYDRELAESLRDAPFQASSVELQAGDGHVIARKFTVQHWKDFIDGISDHKTLEKVLSKYENAFFDRYSDSLFQNKFGLDS